MKKTVSVTGGSGGIGQTLLKYLLENYHVKALFRNESAVSEKWQKQGCQIILGDLSNEESLMNLVGGTEYVFHCAALTASFSQQEAHEVNVEGTRRLAHIAAKSGCKRFIFLSSVAVYTGVDIEDKVYTEEVEIREDPAMELYCLTKLRAETAIKEVAQKHKLEYVILRPTCVYGPSIPSYTMAPVNSIQKGLPAILGDGKGLLDVVYVEDVVQVMLLAADSPQANGEIFNVGGETLTIKEFYSYYSQMLQKPVKHLSKGIANAVAKVCRINQEFGKSFKWYIEIQNSSDKYPSTKAKALLGYRPQAPLGLGMLKTELWLQANDYIPSQRYFFHNASLLYSFSPRGVVHPSTETEIVQIIQEAAQHSLKVKAIGAIHSIAPIPATEGVCIVLDKYKNVVNIKGSLVTVQAGMRIWELNKILAKHNLALPILGAIDKQTVSGAISTATHGGSIYYQSLSGYVHSLRMIRADGSILEVDSSQDIFNAIVISMGLLGIISTVTFKCVPAFSLQTKKLAMPMDALLQKFDEIHQTNKYVDIRYAPITDNAQILSINPTVEAVKENVGTYHVTKTRLERKLITSATELMLGLFHSYKFNWLQRWVIKQDEKTVYTCPSGRSDFVLTHYEAPEYDSFPTSDIEIAIPYSQAGAALRILRDYYHKNRKYPNIYVHIRCSKADNFWLSPAYKQDVCWIEFWEYPDVSNFFREILELLKPFNFRCHWGKQIPVDQKYLEKQYEKWHDFVRLRQEWDSNKMFSNVYSNKYFGS